MLKKTILNWFMKNIKVKKIFKVVCSVGLIAFLLFHLDFAKISTLSWRMVFIPFVVSVLVTLLALLIMSYRWKLLIRQYLSIETPVLRLFNYYLTGMFFNIFLPGAIGGDVVRTKRLVDREGASVKGATTITIVERAAGVYGLGLLLAVSLAVGNFPERFQISQWIPQWLLWCSPIIVLSVVPVLKYLLNKHDLPTTYSFILQTIAVLLLSQMGDVTIAWIFSRSLGIEIGYAAFIFIMPLVYVATVLPISLGGLGVREGSLAGLMMLYGVDASVAIVISLLMYLVKVVVGIIGYFVYLKEK